MGYEFSGHLEHPPGVDAWPAIRGVIQTMDGVSILREAPSSMALLLRRPEGGERTPGWEEDIVVEYDGDELYVSVYAATRTQREEFLDALQSGLSGAGMTLSLEEL